MSVVVNETKYLLSSKLQRVAELNGEGEIALRWYSQELLCFISTFYELYNYAKRMSLVVSSNKQSVHTQFRFHIYVDSHNFEAVESFVYLWSSVNINNNVILVIRLIPLSITPNPTSRSTFPAYCIVQRLVRYVSLKNFRGKA